VLSPKLLSSGFPLGWKTSNDDGSYMRVMPV
jgi:hypothetical protein